MRFLSVCSGIEAASVAWRPLGWQPAAYADVDEFANAVTAHHEPEVPNLGDMTLYEGWDVGSVDLLVGGTPCQSFSVAGLRRGLDDERGNLALTFIRIADRLDPEWVVWENVPGVLSDKTNAFGAFLGGLCGADEPLVPDGRWANAGVVTGPARTAAWRVLDAQYAGVAQRRRRVFVVAVRGSGNWRSAAALFPVGESLHWDTAPRRKAREGFAAATAPSFTASGRGVERTGESRGQDPVVAVARCVTTGEGTRQDYETTTLVAHTLRGEGFDAGEDGTGRGTPLVPVSLALRGREGGAAIEVGDDVSFALRASQGGGDKAHIMAFHPTQEPINSVDVCHALNANANATAAVAFSAKDYGHDVGEIAPTLRAMPHDGSHANGGGQIAVAQAMQVRRLTPKECERLQGFPDDYTLVPFKGKPAPDGRRYKALGNSMAVPVMRWIGKRIDFVRAAYG